MIVTRTHLIYHSMNWRYISVQIDHKCTYIRMPSPYILNRTVI